MTKILAIWPHPDDIELWCFWTMCRLADEWNEVHFLVLSKWEWWSEKWNRIKEAKKSSKLLNCKLHIEDLPDRYFINWQETISKIEKYVNDIKPDIVFIPSWNDTHQDHRAVYDSSLVATRLIDDIYIYQSPSTTMNFKPSVYFDITKYIDIKTEAVKIHTSQSWKIYMADKVIKWLAQYRAFDILKNDKYFEAFEVFRIIK